MRRLYIEDLQPGMMIGKPVIGIGGKVLLGPNVILTETLITKLKLLSIQSVFIKNSIDDVEVPETVPQEIMTVVSENLAKSVKTFTQNKSLNIDLLKNSIDILLNSILDTKALIQLEDIRSNNNYLFDHSVNVAVFSLMTGISLGYEERKLKELGLGAILHDMGMTTVNPNILNSKRSLSTNERIAINMHPETGFQSLRNQNGLSNTIATISLQHHERVDGTGYPQKLKSYQIHEYAKIVSVADTFAAMIADRPYRPGSSVTDAMLNIMKQAGMKYEPTVVRAFANNVAIYPVGCLLMLNTGHIGVVTAINKENITRPVITVIADSQGNSIGKTFPIDLSTTNEVAIKTHLSYKESKFIYNRLTQQSSTKLALVYQ